MGTLFTPFRCRKPIPGRYCCLSVWMPSSCHLGSDLQQQATLTMSCLPYLCSAMLCWVATPSQTCSDSSLPCTATSWLLDWIILKERKEGRKLFMHFSLCEIIIYDLLFYCLFPTLKLADSLVFYQGLEQFLLYNGHPKIVHWVNTWVNEWAWILGDLRFVHPPKINTNTLKNFFVSWTHLTVDVEFTHGNPVIVLGFLLDLA